MKPYIGEIRVFAFDYPPPGWLECDGRALAPKQYLALFAVIGTTYGGGRGTFNLPDLRGRTIASLGAGTVMGEAVGAPQYTLTTGQMPYHSHKAHAAMPASGNTGVHAVPTDGDRLTRMAFGPAGIALAWSTTQDMKLHPDAVTKTGIGKRIDTYQPYVALKACIAVEGVTPDYSLDESQDQTIIVKGNAPG